MLSIKTTNSQGAHLHSRAPSNASFPVFFTWFLTNFLTNFSLHILTVLCIALNLSTSTQKQNKTKKRTSMTSCCLVHKIEAPRPETKDPPYSEFERTFQPYFPWFLFPHLPDISAKPEYSCWSSNTSVFSPLSQ